VVWASVIARLSFKLKTAMASRLVGQANFWMQSRLPCASRSFDIRPSLSGVAAFRFETRAAAAGKPTGLFDCSA